jgi:hypothetical protein
MNLENIFNLESNAQKHSEGHSERNSLDGDDDDENFDGFQLAKGWSRVGKYSWRRVEL